MDIPHLQIDPDGKVLGVVWFQAVRSKNYDRD